jgi:WD40 repeat protein
MDISQMKELLQNYQIYLEVHTSYVNSVAISSNNKYFVSGSGDKTVRLWNVEKRRQEAIFEGHTNDIAFIAITSDNKYIVSGGFDYM